MVFRGGLVTSPFHLGQPPPPAKKGLGAALGRLQTKQVGDKEKGKGRKSDLTAIPQGQAIATNKRYLAGNSGQTDNWFKGTFE